MAYFQKVRQIIGPENVESIFEHVNYGSIDDQMMLDFAHKLGPKIGGNHKRRVEGERLPSDQAEMRRILSDWYSEELYKMNQAEAVLALAKIFGHSDIKSFPLAHKLRSGLKMDEAIPQYRSYYAPADQRVREIIGPNNVDFILDEVDQGTIDHKKMWNFADKLGPTIGSNHW